MFLIDCLISRYPSAKRQTLREMVAEGRVTINGRRAKSLKQDVKEKADVRVADRPKREPASIEPLQIVHEDEDILVVIKPAGLLTSTVANEWRPTAIALVTAYLADRERTARPGVIHRLDFDACGLLVFTKHNEAYECIKRQFYYHTVDRIYTAIVHGHPREESGRIESFLVETPDGSMRSTQDHDKGREAVTDYEVIGRAGRFSVLRVRLHTGRKHQIRAHLSQRGMPVVGDSVYGPNLPAAAPLLLAATYLAFDHPRTGQRVKFETPPPAVIQSFIKEKEKAHQ